MIFERSDIIRSRKFIILTIIIVLTVFTLLGTIIFKDSIINVKGSSSYKNFSLDIFDLKKAPINLVYEDKKIKIDLPIGVKNNIYYIPVNEIVSTLDGKFSIKHGKAELNFLSVRSLIDTKGTTYKTNGTTHKLRHKTFLKQNILYISLFDFANIFNLKTYWNEKSSEIHFYKNKDIVTLSTIPVKKKVALLRLEDISAGGLYNSHEALEKLRIVTDYLYGKGTIFYAAWVPRYIDPSMNIDNNLLEKNNMFNADFVFTLDYMINKNGILGLHGYTHQYGNTKSIDAIEFHRSKKDNIPASAEYAKDRITKAIETAKALDINCDFFEAPHYAILPEQMKVIEKSFKYMYEPYSINGGFTESKHIVKFENSHRKAVYIPTPLGYVDGKSDCINMLNKIRKISDSTVASLFYHPYIEFDYINLSTEKNGYPTYTYSTNSPLHRIVEVFNKKGYNFNSIDNLLNSK